MNKTEKILNIINKKESNLVLSADLNEVDKILKITEQVAPYICGIKLHIDILDNFTLDFINKMKKLSQEYNFFIIEDRKFSDIGNIVKHQLHHGPFQISSWADLVTVHTLMGEGTIEGLISDSDKLPTPGLLLLGQASSKGNLIDSNYSQKTVEMAKKYEKNVVGFICQNRIGTDNFLHFTPGVNISTTGDNLGQQYNSPEYVIANKGSDIIIVGRGIYGSDNPQEAAQKYRDASWSTLCKRKLQN